MCGSDSINISRADNGFVVNWEEKTEGKHGPDYKTHRKIAKSPEDVVEALGDALKKVGGKKKGKKGLRTRGSRPVGEGEALGKSPKKKRGYKR